MTLQTPSSRAVARRMPVTRPGGSARLLPSLLVLMPLLLVPMAFAPYVANQLALFIIYGLLAMSLGLIWGFGGIMSFGQTAFFGIAAYTYGAIALNTTPAAHNTHLAVIGGLVAAALVAALVGYFMFYGRISDVYAAIITVALTLVLYTFFASTAGDEWVIGVARLGGFNGMFGQGRSAEDIANFQIPPVTIFVRGMAEPMEFTINRESAAGYYLVLAACAGFYFLVQWLMRSRLGRVSVAIRENEGRAASLGYDTRFYKLVLFTIAGAVAGFAGLLFAAWGRFVNPDQFGLTAASATVVNVLLGGRSMLIGGFVGAVVTGYLTSYLGELVPFSSVSGTLAPWLAVLAEAGRRLVREAPLLVQGLVLVGAVLLLKDGLAPPTLRLLRRHAGWMWLLLPAILIYFGLRIACRGSDLCLF